MRGLFPDDPALRRRRDRVLLALGIVLALVLVLRAARKDDGVLVRNQEWGARFLEHRDPYEDDVRGGRLHGPYPPSYALVCAPLSLAPTGVARVAWAAAQVGALAALYLLVRRWLERGWPSVAPHAPVLYAIGLLVASRYVLRDTAGGGGNLLYATALLWGIELALAGRVAAPALLVALPLALKPNLAPVAALLVLRARWGASTAVAVALAACFVVPGVWYGWPEWSALWSRWSADVASYASVADLGSAAQVPAGFPVDDSGMNQSLRAALGRLARAGGVDVARAGWLPVASRAISIVLLASAARVAWRARSARARTTATFALVAASLLASPITWKAHHAVLLPAFALLAASALAERRRALAWFLAGYWVVCGLLSEEIVGRAGKTWLQSASVVTWATIALLVALLAAARRDPLHIERAA